MKLQNIQKIKSWRLCVGCGACVCACPENNITLVDVVDDGIRPFLDPNTKPSTLLLTMCLN
ncbi:MAG: 4Fe-4S binding protein [Desulfobacterales bacterium]|nr:4Fe-4S binding protein [Desulfobacterales bacterium]